MSLHRDLRQGLTVALAAAGVLLAVSLVGGSGAAGLVYTAMWWPVLGLALLLRRHGSLSLCFQASAIGSGILLLGIYLIVEDPAAGWRPILESVVPLLRNAGLTLAGDSGEIVEDVLAQGSLLLTLSYSRRFESQADARAVDLMKAVGRDPAALATILERITEKCRDCGKTSWFTTHPGTENRSEVIRQRAEQ